MSNAASHAHAFYKQVAKERLLYTVKDEGGFPAPMNGSGIRCQPFWSSKSRVQLIIKNVPAYSSFDVYEIEWETFKSNWIPGLKKDGLLIGVNWSGKKAMGYDLDPNDVLQAVEAAIDNQNGS